MKHITAELNSIVQEVLGGTASKVLLGRIDSMLTDGSSSREELQQACDKIEKMVKLFIGEDKARIIGKRFKEVLARANT